MLLGNGGGGPVATGLSTLFAAGVLGVLLTAGSRGFTMGAIAIGLVGATALGGGIASLLVDWSGWAHRLAAFWLAVAMVGLVALLRPFPTALTRHSIVIAAAPDAVFRAMNPSPGGAYWKDGVTVSPVERKPGLVEIRDNAEGPAARGERLRVTRDPARRRISLTPIATDAAPVGVTQHMTVEPMRRGQGARLRIAVELQRPTLGMLALHALLDSPSEDARRLKAAVEARAGLTPHARPKAAPGAHSVL